MHPATTQRGDETIFSNATTPDSYFPAHAVDSRPMVNGRRMLCRSPTVAMLLLLSVALSACKLADFTRPKLAGLKFDSTRRTGNG